MSLNNHLESFKGITNQRTGHAPSILYGILGEKELWFFKQCSFVVEICRLRFQSDFQFSPKTFHAEHCLLGCTEHRERLVVKLTLEDLVIISLNTDFHEETRTITFLCNSLAFLLMWMTSCWRNILDACVSSRQGPHRACPETFILFIPLISKRILTTTLFTSEED